MKDGEEVSVQVSARVCGGLAIHKAINGTGYTLTHLPSSLSLATGLRLSVAEQEQALEDIAAQMDWTKSFDEICSIWVHDGTVKEAVFSRLKKLHS